MGQLINVINLENPGIDRLIDKSIDKIEKAFSEGKISEDCADFMLCYLDAEEDELLVRSHAIKRLRVIKTSLKDPGTDTEGRWNMLKEQRMLEKELGTKGMRLDKKTLELSRSSMKNFGIMYELDPDYMQEIAEEVLLRLAQEYQSGVIPERDLKDIALMASMPMLALLECMEKRLRLHEIKEQLKKEKGKIRLDLLIKQRCLKQELVLLMGTIVPIS